MTRHPRQRAGFTLLELLVVIAIIALLMALSFSGIMRVRVSQQVRSTVSTVQKVQTAVDARYKAVIAQAYIDVRTEATPDAQAVINFFNGDKDAAQALLSYARVRQAFPQTFAELQLPNSYAIGGQTTPYFTAGNAFFPVKAEFLPFVNMPAGNLTASQQSAALLYAAVSQTGVGGSTFASDDATSANQIDFQQAGSPTVRVYMDSWRQPIGFCRFGFNSNGANNVKNGTVTLNMGNAVESLQDPPYVSLNSNNVSYDPLDPAGKLQTWKWASSTQYSALFININDPGNINVSNNNFPFNGSNRRPVVYSVGLNGAYESLNMNKAGSGNSDDIMGYLYTQLGQSGIK